MRTRSRLRVNGVVQKMVRRGYNDYRFEEFEASFAFSPDVPSVGRLVLRQVHQRDIAERVTEGDLVYFVAVDEKGARHTHQLLLLAEPGSLLDENRDEILPVTVIRRLARP